MEKEMDLLLDEKEERVHEETNGIIEDGEPVCSQ
jgi:hypothetical protein